MSRIAMMYRVYDKDSRKSVRYDGTRKEAGKYVREVVNLRKLVYEQLEAVEESMETAKRTLDQIHAQIREVRVKLKSTTGRTGRIREVRPKLKSTTGRTGRIILDWEEQADLERLKKEVRTLKYKIPYSLIYPSPPSVFLTDNPNIVWHPRTSTTTTSAVRTRARDDNTYKLLQKTSTEDMDWKLSHKCNPDFYFLQHSPILPRKDRSPLYRRASQCLYQFPMDVFIKQTLLLNCFRAHHLYEYSSWPSYNSNDSLLNTLVTQGVIKTICKMSTNTVSSYWVDFARNEWYTVEPHDSVHFPPPLPSEEQEILYSDNRPIIQKRKSVQVLLLGKWHRSLPLSQHIEVADPDLFYKGMENLTKVKYISLRGISMIPEIPHFITKLKRLEILDCKACHNLEVIPDNINKLSRTLTHLDVSECHLLDHMRASLSDLIHLEVLKGFHIGEPSQRKSCTLRNLTKLSRLEKLHISTSFKGFPSTDHLTDLQKFRSLRNLGITWRGCQTHSKSTSFAQRVLTHKGSIGGGGGGGDFHPFSNLLEKLDLQCVPDIVTHVWLNPFVFPGLKKLYITGGRFYDLGQNLDEPNMENASVIAKGKRWTVEILRLKHLR